MENQYKTSIKQKITSCANIEIPFSTSCRLQIRQAGSEIIVQLDAKQWRYQNETLSRQFVQSKKTTIEASQSSRWLNSIEQVYEEECEITYKGTAVRQGMRYMDEDSKPSNIAGTQNNEQE